MLQSLQYLQNIAHTTIGSNISDRQADNEVLAMLLRDLPTDIDAFHSLRGDREWVSMSVMVMDVAQAGFSSVPYVSSAKKGEKTATKRLYEDHALDNGNTNVTCYPFEKGKTNKDKGKRVEIMSIDNEDGDQIEVPACAQLCPGLTLTNFLREDTFTKDSKFFQERPEKSVLPAGTMIFLQISSQNIEQAQKGCLFKVRKMMPARNVDSLLYSVSLKRLPSTAMQYEEFNKSMSELPPIKKQTFSGAAKFFSLHCNRSSFAVLEEDKHRFIVVQDNDKINDIEIGVDLVNRACGSNDSKQSHKILSIALSIGAVSMLVTSSNQGGVVLKSDCAATALWIYVDFRKFLHFENLFPFLATNQSQVMQKDFSFTKSSQNISWINKNTMFLTGEQNVARYVLYDLSLEETHASENCQNTTNVDTLITVDVPGLCNTIKVFLVPETSETGQNIDSTTLMDPAFRENTPFLTLQLNTKNFKEASSTCGFAGGSKKRKRPSFEE